VCRFRTDPHDNIVAQHSFAQARAWRWTAPLAPIAVQVRRSYRLGLAETKLAVASEKKRKKAQQ